MSDFNSILNACVPGLAALVRPVVQRAIIERFGEENRRPYFLIDSTNGGLLAAYLVRRFRDAFERDEAPEHNAYLGTVEFYSTNLRKQRKLMDFIGVKTMIKHVKTRIL